MYLPEFLPWLIRRYPHIATLMTNQSRPLFDVLFVDLNPLIYEARAVLPDDGFEPWSHEIFRILDLIVCLVKPSTLLYISADGPAPFAKNSEQRRRREQSDISRASITLGTEFIEKINQAVQGFIEEKVKTSVVWQLPNVIYNSFRTPGEGEHKFFEFIMEMRKSDKWNEDAVMCLCSPDPDLILQCLVLNITKCCLMKRVDADRRCLVKGLESYELIWICLLKEYLLLDLDCDSEFADHVLQDFVALTILLGNDFIPPMKGFDLSVNVMEKVLTVYRSFVKLRKWIVDGNSFNFLNTSDLLSQICPDEDAPDDQDEMTESVIEAYYFVMRYYKEGLPSWTWRYGFESTPPLSAVIQYIRRMTDADIPSFEIDSPLTCIEQLVAILPPHCDSLVPEPLQPLLRNYAYDPHELRREFNRHAHELTETEKARNTFVPPMYIDTEGMELMKDECLDINWNLNFEGDMIPCLPSLFSSICSVYVVSRESSVRLGFKVPEGCPSNIQGLVNKVILVGFPFWVPARVVSVSDSGNETDVPLNVECKVIQFSSADEDGLEMVADVTSYPFVLTKPATTDFMKRFLPVRG